MSTTTAAAPMNKDTGPTASQPSALDSQVEPASPSPSPGPKHRPERDLAGSRRFSTGGVEWVAWVSGTGATGTGSRGLGLVEAVHFAPAANGDQQQHREALIGRGRFPILFDDELLTLFRTATPLSGAKPPAKNGRRNGRRR